MLAMRTRTSTASTSSRVSKSRCPWACCRQRLIVISRHSNVVPEVVVPATSLSSARTATDNGGDGGGGSRSKPSSGAGDSSDGGSSGGGSSRSFHESWILPCVVGAAFTLACNGLSSAVTGVRVVKEVVANLKVTVADTEARQIKALKETEERSTMSIDNLKKDMVNTETRVTKAIGDAEARQAKATEEIRSLLVEVLKKKR